MGLHSPGPRPAVPRAPTEVSLLPCETEEYGSEPAAATLRHSPMLPSMPARPRRRDGSDHVDPFAACRGACHGGQRSGDPVVIAPGHKWGGLLPTGARGKTSRLR